MKRKKPIFPFLLALTALVAFAAALHMRNRPDEMPLGESDTDKTSEPSPPDVANPALASASAIRRPSAARSAASSAPQEDNAPSTNKLQRLADIRETFRTLAAGDTTVAMRTAKQLTDDVERETALLTLVTEWTHGELSPPGERARYVATLGIEAGLGMELVKNPELAMQWANELTEGPGRSALLQQTAVALATTDPAGAFALSAQVPENERGRFYLAVYEGWAANDTAAALEWVDQVSDPAEREAALRAIRQVAPVGIGAELRVQDGYPVINRLLPGTPAELNGQLHPGDRIVALAQGDGAFVDARPLSLAEVVQMIRGTPGTPLQLQVLSADASADSAPRTISIVRDQIKLKR